MRILHIVAYFPPDRTGGVGQVVYHLHGGLRARGHDSVVLTALRTRLAAQALVSSHRFHLDRIAEQWEQRVFSRLGTAVR